MCQALHACAACGFPLTPKSTAYLGRGQYWPLRLADGRFSAAVVLEIGSRTDDPWTLHDSRTLMAGLLSWTGADRPSDDSLAGSDLVDRGQMHVKAIASRGEPIVGSWGQVDGLPPVRAVTHRDGGPVGLFVNGRYERVATRDEAAKLPVMGTWGPDCLWLIAERVHVRGLPIVR